MLFNSFKSLRKYGWSPVDTMPVRRYKADYLLLKEVKRAGLSVPAEFADQAACRDLDQGAALNQYVEPLRIFDNRRISLRMADDRPEAGYGHLKNNFPGIDRQMRVGKLDDQVGSVVGGKGLTCMWRKYGTHPTTPEHHHRNFFGRPPPVKITDLSSDDLR